MPILYISAIYYDEMIKRGLVPKEVIKDFLEKNYTPPQKVDQVEE